MIEGNVQWKISSYKNKGTFILMLLINLHQLKNIFPETKGMEIQFILQLRSRRAWIPQK